MQSHVPPSPTRRSPINPQAQPHVGPLTPANTCSSLGTALTYYSKRGWRELSYVCFLQGKEGMVKERKNKKMITIYRLGFIFIDLKGFFLLSIHPTANFTFL